MYKIIATSDHHLAPRFPFSVHPNPFKDIFFKTAFNSANQVINYAIQNKLPIFNGGDWFDEEKINSPEFAVTYILLKKLRDNNIPMYITLGNHEIDYISGVPSVLESLTTQYKNIYSTNYKSMWSCQKYKDLNVYMMPYMEEETFKEQLEGLRECAEQPACLIIHQNIRGVALGKTSIKEGTVTQDYLQSRIKDKFKFLICGHLHYSHYNKAAKIIIPGSTCSVDFRDENSIKCFWELELDNNYNLTNCKSIPIKNQITFTKYTEGVNPKGKFLRLEINIGDNYKDLKQQLMDRGAIGVKPEYIKEIKDIDLTSYERPIEMSASDWLKEWLKEKHYDEEICESVINLNNKLFEEINA